MDEDRGTIKKILKIWSADRKTRKGIVANSVEDLTAQCKDKMDLPKEVDLKFVLEADGTEIDGPFFCTLQDLTILQVLKPEEQWHERVEPSTSSAIQLTKESDQVAKLVEAIRKKSSATKTNQTDTKLRVTIGWQHWSFKEQRYKQVRSSRGEKSATDTFLLRASTSYDDILGKAVTLYFPKGKSKKGRKEAMEFTLGTARGEAIDRNNFTLQNYFHILQTQKCRIYLLTKLKFASIATSSEDSDVELPPVRSVISNNRDEFQTRQTLNFDDLPIDEYDDSHTLHHDFSQPLGSDTSQPMGHDVSVDLSNTVMEVDLTTTVPETNILTVSPPTTSFALAGTPTVQMKTDRKCVVCYDRDPSAFYFPCGHTSCLVCALHLKNHGGRCPHCRGLIKKIR